jgi:hypothetical protein
MKTHAVKGNGILKSLDSVIIVITMTFVTFMILKSTVLLGDLKSHSGTGESIKFDFPVMPQDGKAVINNNAAGEAITIRSDRPDNAINREESEKAEVKSSSVMSNAVRSIKEVEVKATKVDQPVKINEKSKNEENTPAVDVQFEKSVLENWIKDRDAWEQK